MTNDFFTRHLTENTTAIPHVLTPSIRAIVWQSGHGDTGDMEILHGLGTTYN